MYARRQLQALVRQQLLTSTDHRGRTQRGDWLAAREDRLTPRCFRADQSRLSDVSYPPTFHAPLLATVRRSWRWPGEAERLHRPRGSPPEGRRRSPSTVSRRSAGLAQAREQCRARDARLGDPRRDQTGLAAHADTPPRASAAPLAKQPPPWDHRKRLSPSRTDELLPNGSRLSCGADLRFSQTEFYHTVLQDFHRIL